MNNHSLVRVKEQHRPGLSFVLVKEVIVFSPCALRPVPYAQSKFAIRNPKFAMLFYALCSMAK